MLRSLRLQLESMLFVAVLAALATAGCVGGQSGDEGLSTVDDGTVITESGAAACVGETSGDADGGQGSFECHGASSDGGAGFDCDCDGEPAYSDAESCGDALREACGVEPVEEPMEGAAGPAKDEPPPPEP